MADRVVRDTPPLPPAIAALADQLAQLAGSVAVVLGGSRATGGATPASDWDLGVYYRGELDLAPLRAYGDVHPPGSWGRIMNGGAWLTVGGERVDVILRDLDVVETWSARAHRGSFEIDLLLGYLAGIPTYSLLAERAVAVPIRGHIPALPSSDMPMEGATSTSSLSEASSAPHTAGELPPLLAASAPSRWRFHRDFSLEQARARARRGDAIGATGQCARAVIEHGHAVLCARGQWVLNEKHIIERAGLSRLHGRFAAVPQDAPALVAWVEDLARSLNATT